MTGRIRWRGVRTARLSMRSVIIFAAAVLVAGCDSDSRRQQLQQQRVTASQVQTIHSAPPRPAVLQPPPMLLDEAPPPKPKVQPWEKPTPIVLSPEDEKVRSSLPFSPAIAMDPLDGSKISIRATTPMFEYKGKIYYFSSEENKRAFAANPDAVLKTGGRFTKL